MSISIISNANMADVIHLLSACNLPTDDVGADNQTFFGVWDGTKLIGCIGLEQYGRVGLLRSMAVDEVFRGQQLATKLYNHLIEYCFGQGLSHLYLLTQTASGFFEKHEWQVIGREQVPEEVKSSAEFAHLCPASALCMELSLMVVQSLRLFAQGFNCSQSVFVPFAMQQGVGREAALKLSTGFGGGMVYRGETCGAVTGAMMAIGLLTGRSEAEDTQARDVTYGLIKQLNNGFSEKHGSLQCAKLLELESIDREAWDKARGKGVFQSMCPKFVSDASFMLDKIYQAHKTNR
jgi:C_GCAxxG_C_C family probable redox protein